MNINHPNDLAELPHQKARRLGLMTDDELQELIDRRATSPGLRRIARHHQERRERAALAKLKHADQ